MKIQTFFVILSLAIAVQASAQTSEQERTVRCDGVAQSGLKTTLTLTFKEKTIGEKNEIVEAVYSLEQSTKEYIRDTIPQRLALSEDYSRTVRPLKSFKVTPSDLGTVFVGEYVGPNVVSADSAGNF